MPYNESHVSRAVAPGAPAGIIWRESSIGDIEPRTSIDNEPVSNTISWVRLVAQGCRWRAASRSRHIVPRHRPECPFVAIRVIPAVVWTSDNAPYSLQHGRRFNRFDNTVNLLVDIDRKSEQTTIQRLQATKASSDEREAFHIWLLWQRSRISPTSERITVHIRVVDDNTSNQGCDGDKTSRQLWREQTDLLRQKAL